MQNEERLYDRLPGELWDIVGSLLYANIVPSENSIEIILKRYSSRWTLLFREDGSYYTVTGWWPASYERVL